ncbi:MAG: 5-formyltetrahydrofolate cyclo-ligase [Actinomycetia bacterium]|nr:5-formyltetrahydrofolate cyclo-ligase [Actinomycetes bacterium]
MKISPDGRDINRSKKAIRKSIQEKRDSLVPGLRQDKSRIIAKKFLGLKEYRKSGSILAYFPFRSEIDTRIIIKEALRQGKKVALPRVNKKKLDLYYIDSLSEGLEPGIHDIMEPIPSECSKALPGEIDLVIIPGVGFDTEMNRLGYGGGFYDRLLREIPTHIPGIALAFNLQIVDRIPVSEHDLKIDILITESVIRGA